MKHKEGDKVWYCSQECTIVKCHAAQPYGHKQPTYDLVYPNDFSTLNSRSNFIREDLLK